MFVQSVAKCARYEDVYQGDTSHEVNCRVNCKMGGGKIWFISQFLPNFVGAPFKKNV